MRRITTTVAAFALLVLSSCSRQQSPGRERLVLFCGAGIRPAMDELCRAFKAENSVDIDVNYAGSGVLLGKLQAGLRADLFLPGDIAYVERAEKLNLVERRNPVAWFVPVLAVPKGNPKGIRGLKDLARKDVRCGLGRVEACAVGPVARDLLRGAGLAEKVKPSYEALTVNDLANQLKLKTIDAAILWDAVAKQYGDALGVVPLDDPFFYAVPLAMALLRTAEKKQAALKFLAFAASEKGAACFRKNFYQVPGRKLRLGCGSSFRPVMEDLAARFSERTGCEILRDYGGSGTVLLHIQESKEGDIYVCHDPFAYVCEDRGLAQKWYTVAYIHPVLAVKKGNPKKVTGLRDLLREDLRLGLPHRQYSTRGKILWTILEKHGLSDALKKRLEKGNFFESRTHDLVNQLKLDAVDVAVLWDAPVREDPSFEAVRIEEKYKVDSITSPTSGRTFSLEHIKVTLVRLSFSKEPLLAAQFARFCLSEEGRSLFQKHYFALPPR